MVSCPPRLRLPKALRLNKKAVTNLLKHGKKIRIRGYAQPDFTQTTSVSTKFSLKFFVSQLRTNIERATHNQSPSRIAISVPKRLLKTAVSRNAVKRWIRESFRQHAIRWGGADILITLEKKLDCKTQRQEVLAELYQLFTEAELKLSATINMLPTFGAAVVKGVV